MSRFCHYFVPILSRFCHYFVTNLFISLLLHKIIFVAWLDWLVVPLTTGYNNEPVIRVRVTEWPNFWLIYFSGTARKIMPIIKYEIFSMILSCCVVFKSLDLHNSAFWHMIDIFDPIKKPINYPAGEYFNEFKKLIRKLAGSKSRKIKKLAAWKKIEFLIKKTACMTHWTECLDLTPIIPIFAFLLRFTL